MLTLTSEYALRAMTYLAQHEQDWPIPGRQIAQQAGIPRKYLSKVLRGLVRAEVLESSYGRKSSSPRRASEGDLPWSVLPARSG